jgi:hypothetical protein
VEWPCDREFKVRLTTKQIEANYMDGVNR